MSLGNRRRLEIGGSDDASDEDAALLTSSSRSSGIFASLRSVSSSIRSADVGAVAGIKTPKGGERKGKDKRRGKRESGGIYVPSERSLRKSMVSETDVKDATVSTDAGREAETAMNAPDPGGEAEEVAEVDVAAEESTTDKVEADEDHEGTNAESEDGDDDTVNSQVTKDSECKTTGGGDAEEEGAFHDVASKSFESEKSEGDATTSTVSIDDKENETTVADAEIKPRNAKCENELPPAQRGSRQGDCCGDGGLGRWLQSRLGPQLGGGGKVEWANSNNDDGASSFVLKERERP